MASVLSRLLKKGLDFIEIVGNKLPHPATLFAILAGLVVLVSWLAEVVSLQAIHPAEKSVITVNNLLSPAGLRWMYTHVMLNFVTFPPLGYALTAMICGIASIVVSFCCSVIALPVGIVGIVLGSMARSRIRKSGGMLSGNGMALAGIICGAVGMALAVIMIIIGVGLRMAEGNI